MRWGLEIDPTFPQQLQDIQVASHGGHERRGRAILRSRDAKFWSFEVAWKGVTTYVSLCLEVDAIFSKKLHYIHVAVECCCKC